MPRFDSAVFAILMSGPAAVVAQGFHRDPPALPLAAPLSVSLEAPKDALTAGEAGKVRVVIHAHKSDVDLPDLGRWEMGVYRGNVAAFHVPLKGIGPVPSLLAKGETYELEAKLPGDRLLLYYEEGKEFNLQGPFPPKENSHRPPVSRADLKVEVPEEMGRRWSRPRPEDEGAVPGKYVPGQLLLQFKRELSLEQAEEVVAAEGCRVHSVILSPRVSAGLPVIMSVNFPPDRTIEETLDRFQKTGAVDSAAPNSLMGKTLR